jgi:hypothetical protein
MATNQFLVVFVNVIRYRRYFYVKTVNAPVTTAVPVVRSVS